MDTLTMVFRNASQMMAGSDLPPRVRALRAAMLITEVLLEIDGRDLDRELPSVDQYRVACMT